MKKPTTLLEHQEQTRRLALALDHRDVRRWLLKHGYFPEAYVLPPCFSVEKFPETRPSYFQVTPKNGKLKVPRTECMTVHFPKTQLTDRTFGIIDPRIHYDIVVDLTSNWTAVVEAMLPQSSQVASFGFPIPVDSRRPGRMGHLRSGRSIYEFLRMAENQLVAIAYRHSHIVRTDIKNCYRSIYTHAIPWAIHGKSLVRKPENIHNAQLLGNRLDTLFQNANDGCTNGIPIGPVVSDIIAEIVMAAVDVRFTEIFKEKGLKCEAARFKDDYRILVKSEADGIAAVKYLQAGLKEYNLELAEEKTEILALPDGLFRPWVSLYHSAHPRKRASYSWREFRELYLAVLKIDQQYPGTGVVDRFLADIVSKTRRVKISLQPKHIEQTISMLLMLARLRTKAFPKILAIIEAIMETPSGRSQRQSIIDHLEEHLYDLSNDEARNKYLITWISYFLVTNGVQGSLQSHLTFRDPITSTAFYNRSTIFASEADFTLFCDCHEARKRMTLLEYLDVFQPPKED